MEITLESLGLSKEEIQNRVIDQIVRSALTSAVWNEDGDERIPLDVSEGDVVIYSKYGGTEIKYNGEEYLILSARDVLAVVGK
mgnify:CR=1 FL=1